jgi:hypothetical protein
MPNKAYEKQVELMRKVIPFVAQSKLFALKSGTAINFFLRDMPRLSVDIDLIYLPIESRKTSIENMNCELRKIRDSIKSAFPNGK